MRGVCPLIVYSLPRAPPRFAPGEKEAPDHEENPCTSERAAKPRLYRVYHARLFLYTLLVIIPIACSIFYSFFEWSGIGPMKFVGLENFRYLLFGERMSGVFFNALKNNLIYLLCVLLIITPIQLFTAYLLYLKIPCHKYIRTMTFLPYVLSTSIVGFFALLLFDGNMGVLNTVIKALFGRSHTQSWLGDPKLMFPIFVLLRDLAVRQLRHDDLLC